ncbi:NnrU family protein [Kordiimonas sp.]|uniref:NnrU family protein n=1 Tax=Kordiimonas sp. TaxID=1970157 RepID=UPI003A94D3B2
MIILLAGLLVFVAVHLLPVFGLMTRASLMARLGKNAYRGLFSLVIIGSLALVYFGWTMTEPTILYAPPQWAFHVTPLLVLFGFILFFSSRAPSNIRRLVRHPQLTGVLLWAIGHLLANGEQRSVLLFGTFLVWTILAMVGANRRDGDWVKPPKQSFVKDIVTVFIGAALYTGFLFIHEWLIGVNPLPFAS